MAEKETKEGNPEPFFWIDCIAINQHKVDGELGNLGDVLRDATGTVALCDPWDKPVAVSRSWCLYEFLTTIQSKRSLIVALSREQQASFVASLVEHFDSVDRWISRVDARQASASLESDKARIDATVSATVGFGRLNETVQVALKRWLADAGEEALARLAATHGSRHPRVLALQNSLGMMLRQQQADRGALARALGHCGAVLEARREALGDGHPDTLAALGAVGMIRRALGDGPGALAALHAAADGLAGAHAAAAAAGGGGGDHLAAATLRAANDLAFTLKAQGQLAEAEARLREALAKLEAAVAELQGARSLETDSGGGGGDGGWKKEDAPEPRPVTLVPEDGGDQAQQLPRRRQLDDLEDVRCSLMSNLGGVLAERGAHGEALGLLEASLSVKQRLKGAKHPSSLMTAADVAMARHAKALAAAEVEAAEAEADAAEAVSLQREVLAACAEVLGGEHRHTAMLLNNLAVMLAEQRWWRRDRRRQGGGSGAAAAAAAAPAGGEEEEAGPLFERSVRAYMRSRGPGHPCTLAVLLNWGTKEAVDAAAAAAAAAAGHGLGDGADADGGGSGRGGLPPPLRRLAAHVREHSEAREALQAAAQTGLLRVLLAEPGASGAAHKSFHVRPPGGAGALAAAVAASSGEGEPQDGEEGAEGEGEGGTGEGGEVGAGEEGAGGGQSGVVAALREWLLVSMAANLVLLREPEGP